MATTRVTLDSNLIATQLGAQANRSRTVHRCHNGFSYTLTGNRPKCVTDISTLGCGPRSPGRYKSLSLSKAVQRPRATEHSGAWEEAYSACRCTQNKSPEGDRLCLSAPMIVELSAFLVNPRDAAARLTGDLSLEIGTLKNGLHDGPSSTSCQSLVCHRSRRTTPTSRYQIAPP